MKKSISRNVNNAMFRLEKIILDTLDFNLVVQRVVDSILLELQKMNFDYRIVVLALVDKNKQVLRRVSISQTIEAKEAVTGLPLPYGNVEISLSSHDNYCIKCMKQRKYLITHSWDDILCPPLTKKEAISLQEKVGIKTSLVIPIIVKENPIGMMIFSQLSLKEKLKISEMQLLQQFTDIVGIAVQNSQLYSSLQDTTEKLQAANTQLKEADELKDEFVYVASHELRTPMTAIKNYLWLALNHEYKSNPQELKKNLKRAYISTERLIKLVQDMLTVSRIEGKRLILNFEIIDLMELYSQIVDELKVSADKEKIRLILVPTKEKLYIKADRVRIAEVIQNLIGNAMKFTPRAGSITIYVKKNGSFIETSVSDTGYGIPKEDFSRLFKKFGRLGHSYKKVAESAGTGLGLFITKQIVEAHNGSISVTSEVDKGSVFTFLLPIKTEVKVKDQKSIYTKIENNTKAFHIPSHHI